MDAFCCHYTVYNETGEYERINDIHIYFKAKYQQWNYGVSPRAVTTGEGLFTFTVFLASLTLARRGCCDLPRPPPTPMFLAHILLRTFIFGLQ